MNARERERENEDSEEARFFRSLFLPYSSPKVFPPLVGLADLVMTARSLLILEIRRRYGAPGPELPWGGLIDGRGFKFFSFLRGRREST